MGEAVRSQESEVRIAADRVVKELAAFEKRMAAQISRAQGEILRALQAPFEDSPELARIRQLIERNEGMVVRQ